jgi:KDO2-lipid IV(A) lauroyltransferase
MTRLGLAFFRLVSLLPLPFIAALGRTLGFVAFACGGARVSRINLRLCFPDLSEKERNRLARELFRALGRSLLEQGVFWWSPKERVRELVSLVGGEHLDAVAGQPVLLLAPHFVGLDLGGARVALDYRCASIYSRQKNPVVDELLLAHRERFGPLTARQDGLRPVVRLLRDGVAFYYLPDMDFGDRDAVFVPFFGVPAATITTLSRLAKLTGARVVPCITRQLPEAGRYETRLYPAWENFPSDDPIADARRMNAFIEERVREMPEQYFWVHKRFRTRPPGGPNLYA